MKPQKTNINDVRLVSGAVAGATGPEIMGGPRDGALDAFMVIAQIEVIPVVDGATGSRERAEVLHLGMTREAALDIAEKLRKAAALLPME